MTDPELTDDELERFDVGWDQSNLGRTNPLVAADPADAATIGALRAIVSVSPPMSRRIWVNAVTLAGHPSRSTPRWTAAHGGRSVDLVGPSVPGWGWLSAGLIAGVTSLAILGGVFFAGDGGDGVIQTLPGDASSVVATLPSAAPGWATPGGTSVDR